MSNCLRKRLFCLALSLTVIVSATIFGQDNATGTKTTTPGLVTASDGFTYYYDKSGNMVISDYVRIDDNTIYYFCVNGRGVKQTFKILNKHLVQIWNLGSTSCFLAIGDKTALLIDGIFGFGNLKKLATFFTDKPIGIAFTHASVDHSGAGNDINQFKEVYINPLENGRFEGFGKSPFRRFTNDVNEGNRYSKPLDYYEIVSVDDYTNYSPDTKLLPMNDGMTFDLGGLTLEAIWAPGHQPGCTSFLLKEPKILIGGDCAGGGLNDYTVENYRTTILKYIARESEYTSIYSSHGRGDTSLPLYWFKSMLEVCDGVLTGKIVGIPQSQTTYQVYGGKGVRWSTRGVARPSIGALDSRFLPAQNEKNGRVADLSYDPELILNFQK
jgi:hydroxyacylglutathione hydrolase